MKTILDSSASSFGKGSHTSEGVFLPCETQNCKDVQGSWFGADVGVLAHAHFAGAAPLRVVVELLRRSTVSAVRVGS